MFILKLYDRKGNLLKIGDLVKISDGRHFKFFSEIKYLEKEQAIAPFHTFSFHSIEKIDKIPDNANIIKQEGRYNAWFTHNAEVDEDPERYDKYFRHWIECEYLLSQRCFIIELIKDNQLKLF